MSSSPISCTSYSKHHRQLRFKDYLEVTGSQVPDYVTFNPPRAYVPRRAERHIPWFS